MFFNTPLTVTRPSKGHYNTHGRWIEGAITELTIQASIQPVTPNELLQLPEGRRDRQAFKLYSSKPFQVANDRTGVNSDYVEIYGDHYEVISVQPWQNRLISHYKTIVSLRND